MKKIECLAVLVLSSTTLSTFAAEPRCLGNIASVPLHLVNRCLFMVQVPGRLEGGLTLQGQFRDVTAASPHSWMCAPFTARSSPPTPHTNSSAHTPSSIAQTPVHLCNVQPQSSAPSTSSLNFPPAHRFLPPASSPSAIPQTQPPFSDRPRLPLPESLQPPRASTHPRAAIRSVS